MYRRPEANSNNNNFDRIEKWGAPILIPKVVIRSIANLLLLASTLNESHWTWCYSQLIHCVKSSNSSRMSKIQQLGRILAVQSIPIGYHYVNVKQIQVRAGDWKKGCTLAAPQEIQMIPKQWEPHWLGFWRHSHQGEEALMDTVYTEKTNPG